MLLGTVSRASRNFYMCCLLFSHTFGPIIISYICTILKNYIKYTLTNDPNFTSRNSKISKEFLNLQSLVCVSQLKSSRAINLLAHLFSLFSLVYGIWRKKTRNENLKLIFLFPVKQVTSHATLGLLIGTIAPMWPNFYRYSSIT